MIWSLSLLTLSHQNFKLELLHHVKFWDYFLSDEWWLDALYQGLMPTFVLENRNLYNCDMIFLFKWSCGSYLLYLKRCFSFTFQTLPVICWTLFRVCRGSVSNIYSLKYCIFLVVDLCYLTISWLFYSPWVSKYYIWHYLTEPSRPLYK